MIHMGFSALVAFVLIRVFKVHILLKLLLSFIILAILCSLTFLLSDSYYLRELILNTLQDLIYLI